MPHKHKRKQNDQSTYDLPPTLIAKSLPVRDPSKPGKNQNQNDGKGKGGKGKQNANQKPQAKGPAAKAKQNEAATRQKSELEDDTPRAFRQLMQTQARSLAKHNDKKRRKDDDDTSGSDSEGSESDKPVVSRNKNKKKGPAKTTDTEPSESVNAAKNAPKILPGEKLSDFAARVDRELPLSQMQRTAKANQADDLPKIRNHKVTKHEKHLKRLQKQWREDDVRIKEREEAEAEEREEEMEEQTQLWKEWDAESGKKKKRNPNHSQTSSKKRKGAGDDDDGPDPWAKLKKKRATVNPFDVAQEPPQLKKPREIFKMRGGAKVDVANVPAGAGSLRRREELASERRNIVEEYRKLMAEKRGA